jgi:hypothetical protein
LPERYIVEQLTAFGNGNRHPMDIRLQNPALMIDVARDLSAEQVAEAASYFAGLSPKTWVRVVETDRVPKTLIDRYGWRDLDPAGGTEAIGQRIVEVAEDEQLMNSAGPHSGIIAYEPPGSVRRGETLVNMAVRHTHKLALAVMVQRYLVWLTSPGWPAKCQLISLGNDGISDPAVAAAAPTRSWLPLSLVCSRPTSYALPPIWHRAIHEAED